MEQTEQEKGKAFTTLEVIEYEPNSIIPNTIIKKATGSITILAFDLGEIREEKISPFDNYIQVIEGSSEVIINEISHLLEKGQSIIIPAHSHNTIKARTKFKMLSTVIKSGYEEVS